MAAPADGEALGRLRRQADELHARLLPDYFRLPPAGAAVAAPAIPLLVMVAEDGAVVVGYVAVKLVDTPRDPTMTDERRAHVETVVVDQAWRRRGVGSALMRAAADWARRRGAVELVLTVWSDNDPADALYRHLGYEPIARILRKKI